MSNDVIVEPGNDAGDLDGLERELTAAVSADKADNDKTGGAPAGEPKQTNEPADDIPEKYRGKSLQDIIEMHQNAERYIGQLNNDLGHQRKFTDQLLELKRPDHENQNEHDDATESVEITAAEILDNPTAALEKYYAARRERDERQNQERLDSMEGELARGRFESKHPDAAQIGNDPAFVEWLNTSPIRARAAQAVLQHGDWQTADDLLTEWKSHAGGKDDHGNNVVPSESAPDADLEAARKASLESSSNAEASSQSGGKIYRRADLMRLRLEKPDVYRDENFQREIIKAYAEDRVK